MKPKIAWCNTVEGIHETARINSIKAWALGCSCSECNKEFQKLMDDSVKAVQQGNTEMKVINRRIRLELVGGQFTHWLSDEELKRYTVGQKSAGIKSVVIEECMSYADAMKYLGVVK
jgi:hypothetical protein